MTTKEFRLDCKHNDKSVELVSAHPDHATQLLRQNFPHLMTQGAQALTTLAALGGRGELAGVTVQGRYTDGAEAKCLHCGGLTLLRRVVTKSDFDEYVRGRGPFVEPREYARFRRGFPLYFNPGQCRVCQENLTTAQVVIRELEPDEE